MRYKRKGYFKRKTRFKIVKQSCKPEVKISTISFVDQAIQTFKFATATFDLQSKYTLANDILSNITIGTTQNQRIGNSVFVKKMLFEFWIDLCPKYIDTPSTTVACSTSMIRFIVDDGRSASFTNFWRTSVVYPILGKPDRRLAKVHKDFTTNIDCMSAEATTVAGSAIVGEGATRRTRFSIYPNRNVTFNANSGAMKNDSDVYSLRVLGYMPNIPASTNLQTHCLNGRITIYYTDC